MEIKKLNQIVSRVEKGLAELVLEGENVKVIDYRFDRLTGEKIEPEVYYFRLDKFIEKEKSLREKADMLKKLIELVVKYSKGEG